MLSFTFHLPTALVFGPGRLAELQTTPLLPPGKKAMLVIGQSGTILRQGYLDRVLGLLSERGVACVVFDGVRAHPRTEDVDAAAAQARAMGVEIVVGLGGGSVIDTAKCIALAAANRGEFWPGMSSGVWDRSNALTPALPIVAIPTTAGSGSEANRVAVLCGPEGRRGFEHPGLAPALALVDPELTRSCPPELTAASGMLALDRAVDCFLGPETQPMSDMLCLEAASLVARFLPTAVALGQDINARTALCWAATAAGMAQALAPGESGPGCAPDLSPLSRACYDRHLDRGQEHGELDERLRNLAEAMGLEPGADTGDHPFALALDALLDTLQQALDAART